MNWVSILLSTASTKVLSNGRTGERITHVRGLRQGNPISPMLFVIIMEALNSLIHEADRRGVFSPLPGNAMVHRASLYADDLVVLIAPSHGDLGCLHQILQLLAGASGLVTNIDKCIATPICYNDEMISMVR